MPAFISPSVSIPVLNGRLALGTWQSVVLVDPNGDNPHRHVRPQLHCGLTARALVEYRPATRSENSSA